MKRIFSVLMSIVIVLSCVVFIMPPNIVLAANNADDIVSIASGELGSTNYSKYYGEIKVLGVQILSHGVLSRLGLTV